MSNCSVRSRARQQDSFRRIQNRVDSNLFFNALTDEAMFEKLESLQPEHRQRLYPPTETLAMFMAQAINADRSCQHAVNEWVVIRQAAGLGTVSTNTSAYCRARQRLPIGMIQELVRYSAQALNTREPIEWKWKGRSVKLCDGSTVSMPDTTENQKEYPQSKSQPEGVGFPVCRLVGLFSLGSGVLLDVAMGPCKGKGSNEQQLLRQLLHTLDDGDILLADAYFPSYFLMCALQERGIDCLCEQMGSRGRSTDFRTGQSLGKRDHLIEYLKPKSKPDWLTQAEYEAAPQKLQVRELRFSLSKAGKAKTLISTLRCSKTYKKSELKKLYKDRWQVELNLRDIKTTLGMDVLSCHTPQMVRKEIWVYLLAYNVIRTLMAQAAWQAGCLPHQLSFKHSAQLWLAWGRHARAGNLEDWENLMRAMAQRRIGNRAGRAEPRKKKRRPKQYSLLRKPRWQERGEVLKQGHGAKLAP